MRNAGLEEAQAGIKIAGRNINNLTYADDTTSMAKSEELKSLLRKVYEYILDWNYPNIYLGRKYINQWGHKELNMTERLSTAHLNQYLTDSV